MVAGIPRGLNVGSVVVEIKSARAYPLLIVTCLSLVIASCVNANEARETNIETGSTIIDAIYHYERENYSFPAELKALVPIYLNDLPETAEGVGFFYATNPVDGFILSFMLSPRHGCGYSDNTKQWGCGWGD